MFISLLFAMRMTQNQFLTLKLAIVVIASAVTSASIVQRNFLVPLIAVTVSFAVLFYARSHVKAVLADERDYEISGKAARIAVQIFSFAAILPMLYFYAMRDTNPVYEPVASALAYSVCFLMLAYAAIAKYLQRTPAFDRRAPYVALLAIILGLLIVFGIRMMSGEDGWTCIDGAWVAHGQPSMPAPTTACPR